MQAIWTQHTPDRRQQHPTSGPVKHVLSGCSLWLQLHNRDNHSGCLRQLHNMNTVDPPIEGTHCSHSGGLQCTQLTVLLLQVLQPHAATAACCPPAATAPGRRPDAAAATADPVCSGWTAFDGWWAVAAARDICVCGHISMCEPIHRPGAGSSSRFRYSVCRALQGVSRCSQLHLLGLTQSQWNVGLDVG